MIKLLFLIHDLGPGGAEKVLVNLVNNMNKERFDITVISMFGGGVNQQFLAPHIKYKALFKYAIPGNSHLMKVFSPVVLHGFFIRDHYDIEISYLEGPSARVISGCCDKNCKLVTWIHSSQQEQKDIARSFRNVQEAINCYNRFNLIVAVSKTVQLTFRKAMPISVPIEVLYNTVESEKIRKLAKQEVDIIFSEQAINLVAVGKLASIKGFERLFRIINRLVKEHYLIRLYLLGSGPEEKKLRQYASDNALENAVCFLGYQENPYKYISRCDLYICSSFREGFSTAATEALILGIPVCTTNVSGMEEMLGANNEYGIITENNENALYQGIKKYLDDPLLRRHYRKQAEIRGNIFSMNNTVKAVENRLVSIYRG